jgi:ATP-dependent DNA helicase RecG
LDTASLEALIKGGETATTEFKVAPPRPSDLAERICGFANALGGFIIIGVADKTWQVIGVKNVSETIDVILQAARLCKPVVRLDPPQPEAIELEGKQVVITYIPPNNGTLYQTGGVCWIRRGTYTVPMTTTEIQEFLYAKGIMAWEKQPVPRAILADLDPALLEVYLSQRSSQSKHVDRLSNIEDILLNIGCATITKDDAQRDIIRPTRAGMLLFGYDPQLFLMQAEVICILYKDKVGKQRYADRRIIHGTISQQIDQAEAFFKQYVPVPAYMEGFHRIDVPDYPIDALREAIVNAVVHRDYSLEGQAVRVFYYTDRIEIHNPGLLMPGVNLEELQQGKAFSNPRNPVIAGVLRDFPGGYMEKAGTGIRFMINQMRELGRPDPEFQVEGEFVVTFRRDAPSTTSETGPSQTETPYVPSHKKGSQALKEQMPPPDEIAFPRKKRQKLALRYVHSHGFITREQYQAMTGTSEHTAIRDLEALRERGSLRAIEQKRGRFYTL